MNVARLPVLAGLLAASLAHAQSDVETAKSVLQITCVLPGNKEMVSSGFVWRDSQHAVTTLHGVVGCTRIDVRSDQVKGQPQAATIEKVSLEADLALLRLDRDWKLAPINHVTAQPANLRDRFYVWGYPNGVPTVKDDPVTFGVAGGGMMSLKQAFFGSPEYAAVFTDPFPTENSLILRVGSPLQHGHSGAPILDAQGRVVAIADGGLLGGYRMLNWSIPAYRYLPMLAASNDRIPGTASQRASQFSNVTVAAPTTIAVPREAQNGGAASALTRVRTITLAEVDAMIRRKGPPDGNIEFIRGIVEAPRRYEDLSFDIYEDPVTGATLGVPAGAVMAWNPALRSIEARNASGDVRMFVGVLRYGSYADAKALGKRDFVGRLVGLADWDANPAAMALNADDDVEYANNASFFPGVDRATRKPTDMNLSLTVSGHQLLGYAVYGPRKIEELPPRELIAYLMMQLAVQELSGFAAN